MFDANGKIVGATVGPAADFGVSGSYAKTEAVGLSDLGRGLGGWLFNKFGPKPKACP